MIQHVMKEDLVVQDNPEYVIGLALIYRGVIGVAGFNLR